MLRFSPSVFTDTCSSWISCVTFRGFPAWFQFLAPSQWFTTSPPDPVSPHIPCVGSPTSLQHIPPCARTTGIRDCLGLFQDAAQGTCPRCPCTVSGAQAESRKHGKSKGDSPGSACKHPAWRRFKSEWIKGGLTGQGEAAKPNRSDSQTSSTSQRLPVTLWISLFWC